MRRFLTLATVFALATFCAGCQGAAIEANKQQVEQQQQQIEQMSAEIARLKAQNSYSTTAPPSGSCDKGVMEAATRNGGARLAAGDAKRALGYYQDALTACPGNIKAQVNLGRAYEAVGDRPDAISQYQAAAHSPDTSDPSSKDEARAALARLTNKTPLSSR